MYHCSDDRKLLQGDNDNHLSSSTAENISGQQNIQQSKSSSLKSPPPTPANSQELLIKEDSKNEAAMIDVADVLSDLKSMAITKKPSPKEAAAGASKLQQQDAADRPLKATQLLPKQQIATARVPSTSSSRHVIVENGQRGGRWEPPQVYIPQILSITPNLYSRPGIDDDEDDISDDNSSAGSCSDSDYEGDNDNANGECDDDGDDASESPDGINGRSELPMYQSGNSVQRNDDAWMSLVTQNYMERSTMVRRRTLYDIYDLVRVHRGDGSAANQGSDAVAATATAVAAAVQPENNNVRDDDDLSTTDSSMPELIPRHMIEDSSSDDDDSFLGGFHPQPFFFNPDMFDDYYYPGYCEEKKEAW